jgi:signal transduction histidine kinase
MDYEGYFEINFMKFLTRLFPIVREFFRAFKDPYTFNPRKNIYTLFGFLWGVPVPFVTIGLSLYLLGRPISAQSILDIMGKHPWQMIFLLHPAIFYVVFGALGTMDKNRERSLQSETLKHEQTKEQLLVKERMAMIGQLAAGIAHEINNPVGILLAKVGFLKSMASDKTAFLSRIDKDLDKFETHLLRVTHITRSLLSFARQSIGAVGAIDFPQLLGDSLLFMEHGFLKNNITVEKNIQVQTHPFEGCAGELQQVFLNLLGNAQDAMIEFHGGTLKIAFSESLTGFHIQISDSGVGIPPEIQSKVMDPFFTTKELGKGTGLGLSIAYGIVVKHNGTIVLNSARGVGTTFSIFFPARKSGR